VVDGNRALQRKDGFCLTKRDCTRKGKGQRQVRVLRPRTSYVIRGTRGGDIGHRSSPKSSCPRALAATAAPSTASSAAPAWRGVAWRGAAYSTRAPCSAAAAARPHPPLAPGVGVLGPGAL
jgi:hypothetical protein